MYEDQHDSKQSDDDDEGFKTNQIVLSRKEVYVQVQEIEEDKPKDFLPRYLRRDIIIKKEPFEIIRGFEECTIAPKKQKQPRKIKNKHFQSLNQKYSSQQFKSVYQRFKNNQLSINHQLGSKVRLIDHFISLDSVGKYFSQNYGVPKFAQDSDEYLGNQLQFDSRFQSGNLWCAYKNLKQKNQYDLILQNDTNTMGYNQWFYFSVRNMKKGNTYHLNIMNLRKSHSFFKQGMKLLVHSAKKAKIKKCGWKRFDHGLRYYRTNILRMAGDKSYYYALSFDICTQQQNDTFFISMNLPYSYSRLMHFIEQTEKQVQSNKSIAYKRQIGAYTLGMNVVPQLTITNKGKEGSKRVIVVIARQHPVQTVSSYVMEGFIKYLLKDNSKQAKQLRNNFVFKIYPMINVDGVIYGNSRCGLDGTDLNRQWGQPCPILHPSIFSLRNKIFSEQNVQFFLDFHGHSKKLNCFGYGCKDQQNINFSKQFPLILSKIEPGFVFPYCTFGVDKFKQMTARAQVFKKRGVQSLTIESSYFGVWNQGDRGNWNISYKNKAVEQQVFHWQPFMLNRVGQSILRALFVYYCQDEEYCTNKYSLTRSAAIRELVQKLPEIEGSQNEEESDSDPQEDQIDIQAKITRGIIPQRLRQQLNFKKSRFRRVRRQGERRESKLQTITHQTRRLSKEQKSVKRSHRKQVSQVELYKAPVKKGKLQQSRSKQVYPNRTQMKRTYEYNWMNSHKLQQSRRVYNKQEKSYYRTEQKTLDSNSYKERQIFAKKQENKFRFIQATQESELPMLCILSQKKKKLKIEQIKGKIIIDEPKRKEKQKQLINYNTFRKMAYQQKKERHSKQKKQDKKKGLNLNDFSKLWKDNINRYGISDNDQKRLNRSIFL